MQISSAANRPLPLVLEDKDASAWLSEQIARHISHSSELAANVGAVTASIIQMGKDFEDAMFSLVPKPSTASYFHTFVDEMLGNFFINSQVPYVEVEQKIKIVREAAKIYLQGQLDPSAFVGYPVLKIVITKSTVEAGQWVGMMQQKADKVRAIMSNRLEWLIDDAASAEELGRLIDEYKLPVDRSAK
jgi:hypothetical protein